MSLFILRFILFSGALYLCYRLLFSRKSFFRLNRAVLLAIPLVSVLIPLLAPMFESPFAVEPIIRVMLPEIGIDGTIYEYPLREAEGINYWWLIYAAGAILIITMLVVGLVRAWSILRQSSHAFDNVHFSDKANGPFAFFQHIIIPQKLLKSEELQNVLAHEKAHVDQLHALDNLYYNILAAIFWFNPFIHLLQSELRQTHECLADQKALAQSDPENYSRLLLTSVFGSEMHFDPANRFFNSSLIKTRITMIYKAKTKPIMKGLYFLLIPLIAVMSITSCQKTEDSQVKDTKASEVALDQVDLPPLFPGCDPDVGKDEMTTCFKQMLANYVGENFRYPASAQEAGLEGKIFVEFNINKEGVVKVVGYKSNFEEDEANAQARADAENFAVDLVAAMPKMDQPAFVDGKPVPITMTLPIMLKLE